ncbi:MAG: pilin [Parcubacteria group bacterium]
MNKKVYKISAGLLVLVCGMMFVGVDTAQATDYGLSFVKGKGMVESDWVTVVANVIRAVLGIVGVLLLVMMIYGGVVYMTSAGSEDRVAMGKKVLSYAIFGVVIIALAFVLTTYVISAFFGGDSSGSETSSTSTSSQDSTKDSTPSLVS